MKQRTIKSKIIISTLLILAVFSVFLSVSCLFPSTPFKADSGSLVFNEPITTPFGTDMVYILSQDNENVYAGGANGKFAVYDKEAKEFGSLIATPFGTQIIYSIVQDNKNVFVSDLSAKFAIYNKEAQAFGSLIATPFGTGITYTLSQDNENVYAGGAQGKFAICDKGTQKFGSLITTPFGTNSIFCSIQDNENVYAGGANGTFAIYSKEAQAFGSLIATPFVGTNSIQSLEEDNENVYAGGLNGLFAIYDKEAKAFGSLIPTPFKTNSIIKLLKDKVNENIYALSNTGELAIYNKETKTFGSFITNPFKSTTIRAIINDENNIYATGAASGFAVLQLPQTQQEIKYPVNFYDKENNLIATQEVVEGSPVSSFPTAPSYTDLVASGWLRSDGKALTDPITEPTNFYAQYSVQQMLVQFRTYAEGSNGTSISYFETDKGNTISIADFPVAPSRTGLVFTHWAYLVSGNYVTVQNTDTFLADKSLTFYAFYDAATTVYIYSAGYNKTIQIPVGTAINQSQFPVVQEGYYRSWNTGRWATQAQYENSVPTSQWATFSISDTLPSNAYYAEIYFNDYALNSLNLRDIDSTLIQKVYYTDTLPGTLPTPEIIEEGCMFYGWFTYDGEPLNYRNVFERNIKDYYAVYKYSALEFKFNYADSPELFKLLMTYLTTGKTPEKYFLIENAFGGIMGEFRGADFEFEVVNIGLMHGTSNQCIILRVTSEEGIAAYKISTEWEEQPFYFNFLTSLEFYETYGYWLWGYWQTSVSARLPVEESDSLFDWLKLISGGSAAGSNNNGNPPAQTTSTSGAIKPEIIVTNTDIAILAAAGVGLIGLFALIMKGNKRRRK